MRWRRAVLRYRSSSLSPRVRGLMTRIRNMKIDPEPVPVAYGSATIRYLAIVIKLSYSNISKIIGNL